MKKLRFMYITERGEAKHPGELSFRSQLEETLESWNNDETGWYVHSVSINRIENPKFPDSDVREAHIILAMEINDENIPELQPTPYQKVKVEPCRRSFSFFKSGRYRMNTENTRDENETIDKSEWPDGPWHTEPDKLKWRDEATGYRCLINRVRLSGAFCGYVGINEGHPSFGKEHDDPRMDGAFDVHGGITFTGEKGREGWTAVEDGEEWWIGFDCSHLDDIAPGFISLLPQGFRAWSNSEYRDINYVKAEVESLAKQLKKMEIDDE